MSINSTLLIFVLMFAGFSTTISAQPSDSEPRVSFPEAGLTLVQPPGFEKAGAFHGFQQKDSGASVLVASIPGPYSEVTRGFTADRLAGQGMTLISKEAIAIGGGEGLLLHLRQSAYGQEFLKWMVVFGGPSRTSLATATFPETHAENLSELLKNTVLGVLALPESAKTDGPPKLPFSIGSVEGLSPVARIISLGKMAAFTRDGTIPVASPSDPLFIVGPSLGNVPVGDRESFARRRLEATTNTKIEAVTATAPVSIDGLDGFEMLASGTDEKDGTALTVFQIMLFPPGEGYILMTGLVGEDLAETYLPKFRTLAKSYKNSPE